MAKVIMIQGTNSNAGKSFIVAGLCRIFAQDGYRVAPFKSQNMALNSYITNDGLEIGRAQAMQAEAAKKEPDVRMNPILLKPTCDQASQVIVGGRAVGNISASDYFKMRTSLKQEIMSAFNSLAEENDIIVIEGAGSPAEINLMENDIVNMGMAQMASAPVLIAGDIDRGGVFASLYGTIMLLKQYDRYIKGTIINRFRGDVEILKPGLNMLEDLVKLPVVGVIPYLQVDIDDEDSLSEKLLSRDVTGQIDIAVIRLPHISNFTDYSSLERIDVFSVRYVTTASQFKSPDFVILPGTKSTITDLKWLRESGLEPKLLSYVAKGKPLFGICGGYQMLCKRLSDPHNTDGGGEVTGLSLIDADTVFEEEKVQTRVVGEFNSISGLLSPLSGKKFEGYEIHMGKTVPNQPDGYISTLTTMLGETKYDGLKRANLEVYGSYVHGLFDSDEVLHTLAEILMREKGLKYSKSELINIALYKETQYDILANELRKSLDMDKIYEILNEGV